MKEDISISLQLLFLNDLLYRKVIDQTIYNKAIQKITAFSIIGFRYILSVPTL